MEIKGEAEGYVSRSFMSALLSNFSEDQTEMSIGLDIAIGFIPGVGTIASGRDFIANILKDDKLGMVLAGAGLIPFVGGIVKSARGTTKAASSINAGAKALNVVSDVPVANVARQAKNVEAGTATFGKALSSDYKATFFAANPELKGQVVVHHAVEKQTLDLFPRVVNQAEIHSLENLRGIPKNINFDVHLSQIRREWNLFYRTNPSPTKEQLLNKATEIDLKYGSLFQPPR